MAVTRYPDVGFGDMVITLIEWGQVMRSVIYGTLFTVFLACTGTVQAADEKRQDSEIIHDAIRGKTKDTYWLLMNSLVDPSGYEKVILVSGFWDNSQVCEELKIWGNSNPMRKNRTFGCAKAPGR